MNCEYCNNNFQTKKSLKVHQKTSNYCLEKRGEKNTKFQCNHCNKIFSQNVNLQKHLKKCFTKDSDIIDEQKKEIIFLKKQNETLKLENENLKLKMSYEIEICNLKLKLSNTKNGNCEHGKRKNICKECNGSSICEHEKLKSLCKECGGSELCRTPLCEVRKNKKYDGFCFRCFIYNNPNVEISRNYKTKERSVIDYIFSIFPIDKYTWVHDKKVVDGCSSKRPDLLLDLGYMIIIIEIDENQHQFYDSSCESNRIMTISKDLQYRPIIMIRFNPDDYKSENGKKISSPWTTNKLGICVINKDLEFEWNKRLKILSNTIEYYLDPINKIDKTIEIKNLFFNS
jgi:hypothetical protein